MLKNFIKIAWRNSMRHSKHTIINVFGLATGITCCLFIFLWVQREKGVDNFHANGKNLFALYETMRGNGKVNSIYDLFVESYVDGKPDFPLEAIKNEIPEIKNISFYATGYELPWGHPETFRSGEKIIKMSGSRAGKDFFKMFSYPLIEGRAETALQEMNGIAISRKMAELFFGSPEKAMGQTLLYENRLDFVVKAVFENVPPKSSLQFDFLLNWDAQKNLLEWASNGYRMYLQVNDGADARQVEKKITSFLQKHSSQKDAVKTDAGLQPFGDQYLHNVFINGKPTGGRIEYVRIFTSIALFVLLIACINFMNLSTARSIKRAKEVGLRKVAGSSRTGLIFQFMGESMWLTFIAMTLALILIFALRPVFGHLTGSTIAVPVSQPGFWLYFAALLIVTGLVAGSYPALYLSSLQPVRVLKGVVKFSTGSVLFRKGLTVFQFVLSIFLVISTIVIIRQTSLIQDTHLGYDRENLIYIRVEGELANGNKYALFKQQLSAQPGIAMIDRSTEAPHSMGFTVYDPVQWEGKGKNSSVGFKPTSVGFDFLKLMNIQIAEGRDFSRLNATDSTDAFMVNEEAVKEMGMKNPIGKWISAWGKKGHIIAILKDFHSNSLREPILPVLIDVKEDIYFGVIIVRTKPGETKQALASMAKLYKIINPNYPFAYQFVDEEYKKMYESEQMTARLTVVFTMLAILISCLGLLGLVMFAAEQRRKEIGVRKVLGASLGRIVILFSGDFLQLVFIAFLVASPLAWIAANRWLQNFVYRVNISWWIFVLALVVALIVTTLTIIYQSLKAAGANPVKSLRSE